MGGQRACAAATLGALASPAPLRARVLVGLANSPSLTVSQVAAALTDRVAAGLHHEINLGDPRRRAPEKLTTILRQPVRPA